ncbi:MAG TPA: ATP-binding protein [Pseudomonadales bacterium]|nr:ATP-binding protein [Pseudomonadales bacterium]
MSSEIVFGLESAAWPALLVDPRGIVVRANASALTVFGQVLSAASPPLTSVWPKDGETVEQFFARWEQKPFATAYLKFRTAAGPVTDFSTTICTFTKDGKKWFVLQLLPTNGTAAPAPAAAASSAAAASPAPGSGEKDPVIDAAATLLTKQKLDCALQLARTVSLDFNNALTSILGHTSLLLGKAESGHPWRHSLMEVEKSAARAAEISNELGVFSQQEKQSQRVPPGNLNEVLARCVEFFKNNEGAKVTWNLNLEKELFTSRFEEAKIQQALTKVLENAVDAVNGRGQVVVQTRNVELTTAAQDRNIKLNAGDYVSVEISDNGAGVEAVNLPRVFEPFFTTKKPPHRGLGLALVYGIISNHGGGVTLSSEPGKGASVRIYLPAEKQLISQSTASDTNLHGTESILVVDDEGIILTMSETILSEYGYKIFTINNGQKALTLLAREDLKVDLLITDLVMPAMGGRELIERARQLQPQLKILCMSGTMVSPDQQVGLTYLQKPFTSRDLLAKVRAALGKN